MFSWPIFGQGNYNGMPQIPGVPTGYPLCPLPPSAGDDPSFFIGTTSQGIYEIGDSTDTLLPLIQVSLPNTEISSITPNGGAVLGPYIQPRLYLKPSVPPLYISLADPNRNIFTNANGYGNGEILGFWYFPDENITNTRTGVVQVSMTDPPGVFWQSATNLNGSWTNLPGGSNAYTLETSYAQQFFRLAFNPANVGPLPPIAATYAPATVSSNSAAFEGFVLANGAATGAWFEYGPTTNYGSTGSLINVSATNSQFICNSVPMLSAGTFYHFRLDASNSAGTSYGSDMAFTTLGVASTAPTAVTGSATGVSNYSAMLNGQITPNSGDFTWWFEYGMSTNYTQIAPGGTIYDTDPSNSIPVTSYIDPSNWVPISYYPDPSNFTPVGLNPGTIYHFQLVASNYAGVSFGGDMTFTTPAAAPLVETLPATALTTTNVTLNGLLAPNGASSTFWFEYGPNQSYGSNTPPASWSNSILIICNSIPVTAGITYHYQLVGSNSAGVSYGGDRFFYPINGTAYVGNSLPPPGTLGADLVAPLVILGEYNPSGPLSNSEVSLYEGTVQDVRFYGQNYDFTLYALSMVAAGPGSNEVTFQVTAEESFSGTETNVGTHTLPVSGFNVSSGELLAFAGTGPYYPQSTNDAPNSDATYEDASNPGSFSATPPGGVNSEFIVGLNPDTNANYEYIPNSRGNQGRSYAIGVDIANYVPPPPAMLGAYSLLIGPGNHTNSVVLAIRSNIWIAIANSSWLHTTMSNGTGSTNVVFTCDGNTGSTRTGSLTIAGLTLTVTQAGSTYVQAPQTPTTLVSNLINGPTCMAVDQSGNVYFAQSGQGYTNPALGVWSLSSNTATMLVSSGLVQPHGLAVDGESNVYIADYSARSIKEWTAASSNLTTLIPSNYLGFAAGVVIDTLGDLYVADYSSNAIKEWVAAGSNVTTLLQPVGSSGPTALAVDAAQNVYFSAFESPNTVIGEWLAADSNVVTLIPGLDNPSIAAVDGSGNLYINSGDGNSYEWIAAGTNLVTVPNGDGGVRAVDVSQNVYLAGLVGGLGAVQELPYAFVDPTPKSESAAAGSDTLPPVLPTNQNLLPPFNPTSDSSWLTISGISNGVVSFSFSTNSTGNSRTGHITLLGQFISVNQSP